MALSTHDKMLQMPYAITRRGGKSFVVDKYGSRGASGLPMASVVYGIIMHWIVSTLRGSIDVYQSLGLIINGHSKLRGPLANFYIAFNGDIGCVAAGRANHGGVGIHRGVQGNQFFLGTEAEGPPFNKMQIEAYAILLAAVWDVFRIHPATWAIGHDEYATPKGRKQDIGAYSNQIRARALYLIQNNIFIDNEESQLEEEPMLSRLIRAHGSPEVYLVQGNTRTHIPNEDRLKDIKTLNREFRFLNDNSDNPQVRVVSPEVLRIFKDVTPPRA